MIYSRRRQRVVIKIKVLEKTVLQQVLQYLRLRKCLCYRMNTGAGTFQNKEGPRRFVKFGEKGMADIIAWTKSGTTLWVECKGSTGKQSELQRHFQGQVEAYGHIYIVAHSIDDILPLFEGVKK
jgi:hypothetical protein